MGIGLGMTSPLHDLTINASIVSILETDDVTFALGLAEMINTFLEDDGWVFRFNLDATLMETKIAAQEFIATFLPGKLGD